MSGSGKPLGAGNWGRRPSRRRPGALSPRWADRFHRGHTRDDSGPGRQDRSSDGARVSTTGRYVDHASKPQRGVLAAGGSSVHTIRLWDVAAGLSIGRPLVQHLDFVNDVAFSPDGKSVATGCHDGNARVWDAETGEPRTEPLPNDGDVLRVAFFHDGRSIVTAGIFNRARIWDVATGKEVGQGLSHSAIVRSVALSPDGQFVVTAGQADGTAKIWEIPKPMQGDAREIGRRIRKQTGMDLDERRRFLNASELHRFAPAGGLHRLLQPFAPGPSQSGSRKG